MKTSEVLIAARALIDTPETWCQGEYDHGDAHCGLGAIRVVVPLEMGDGRDARNALIAQIDCDFFDEWQDNPRRTHAEVMAVFDLAIAAEQAIEGR